MTYQLFAEKQPRQHQNATTHEAASPRSRLAGLSFAEGERALAPGAAPVQLDGGGAGLSPSGVHAAAHHGVAGGGSKLPYAEAIQASFGRHDVSGIRAHVGGAATEACGAMGANAYASGNAVAFKGGPDLHTAAHEAAHVVQQRAGVSLKGGVGASGDAYERHADAVADLVVQGKSAEGLLDRHAGGAGAGVQPRAVQHKGKTGRALARGGKAFSLLYKGGNAEGMPGLWSKGAGKSLVGTDDDKKKKTEKRKVIGMRVGVVVGNILTAGLVNLPFLAGSIINANRGYKAKKRAKERKEEIRHVAGVAARRCKEEIKDLGLDQEKVKTMLEHMLGLGSAPSFDEEEWMSFQQILGSLRGDGKLVELMQKARTSH